MEKFITLKSTPLLFKTKKSMSTLQKMLGAGVKVINKGKGTNRKRALLFFYKWQIFLKKGTFLSEKGTFSLKKGTFKHKDGIFFAKRALFRKKRQFSF